MVRWRQSVWIAVDADSVAHDIQIIVNGLIYDSRASLFGIGRRWLALIQLIQPTVPLTLLALFATTTVGPRGIG